MATTGISGIQPEVVQLGGAVPEYYAYLDNETIGKGDLIRITSAGTVKLAEINTSAAGAVHGIALEDGEASSTEALKVMLFAVDTYVKLPTIDSVAPADLAKGQTYTLEDGTNTWGVTSTTTNGVATIVDFAGSETPWTIARGGWDETTSTDNNSVIVKFAQAILDGHSA